jgi:16S rRNA (adenine1518-N6/adenine1519-N6)-dimethyltransferase
MKLSDMKAVLASRQLQLTKSLGQNFLHDANQLAKIVAAGEVSSTDRILEIGPGLGPLTEVLLQKAAHVLAIEKDHRLVEILRERFTAEIGSDTLELREADALEILQTEPVSWSGWKLVANLPYSVASPILVELASSASPPERLVATLQIEVAKRLAAIAGEDYGLLTLLVQLNYESRGWFKIPASCFFPEPDVDSACITLVKRPAPLLPPDLHPPFRKIVKRSFSQRRKMMFKLLKADWDITKLQSAFATVALPPQIRAEAVSLEQFVGLTRALAANSEHG